MTPAQSATQHVEAAIADLELVTYRSGQARLWAEHLKQDLKTLRLMADASELITA